MCWRSEGERWEGSIPSYWKGKCPKDGANCSKPYKYICVYIHTYICIYICIYISISISGPWLVLMGSFCLFSVPTFSEKFLKPPLTGKLITNVDLQWERCHALPLCCAISSYSEEMTS